MLNDENEPKDIYYAMNRFLLSNRRRKIDETIKQMDTRRNGNEEKGEEFLSFRYNK